MGKKPPPEWLPKKPDKATKRIRKLARAEAVKYFGADHPLLKYGTVFRIQHPDLPWEGAFMAWLCVAPDLQ